MQVGVVQYDVSVRLTALQRGGISRDSFLQRRRQGRGFSISTHLGLKFKNKLWACTWKKKQQKKTHGFTILYISRTQIRLFPFDIQDFKQLSPSGPGYFGGPRFKAGTMKLWLHSPCPRTERAKTALWLRRTAFGAERCDNLAYICGRGSKSFIHSLLQGGQVSRFIPSSGPNLWRA